MNRYESIFNIKNFDSILFNLNIKNRETDIFLEYHVNNRLDLISNRIYGSPEYYWIILEANGYSIEYDIIPGDILRIPFPLESILEEIRLQVESN